MEFTIMPTGFRLRRVGITITITITIAITNAITISNYEHDKLVILFSYLLSPVSCLLSPISSR